MLYFTKIIRQHVYFNRSSSFDIKPWVSHEWLICLRVKTNFPFQFLNSGADSFSSEVLIHFYIGIGHFEFGINDHSWSWFGYWVYSIFFFDSDLTRNSLEYDGFSFEPGMYFLQELGNQLKISIFFFFPSKIRTLRQSENIIFLFASSYYV